MKVSTHRKDTRPLPEPLAHGEVPCVALRVLSRLELTRKLLETTRAMFLLHLKESDFYFLFKIFEIHNLT